jgi:hypothetical protein
MRVADPPQWRHLRWMTCLRPSRVRRSTRIFPAPPRRKSLVRRPPDDGLLLDLEDVYWSHQGRKSVDAAIGIIAAGGTFFAGLPFWRHAQCALWSES